MKDNRETIFRKNMVDRLSSPDELVEMVRITKRPDWLILSGIALIVLGASVWAIVARLPIMVRGMGVLRATDSMAIAALAPTGSGDKSQAVVFVSDTMADQVRPGLAVRVAPKDYPSKQYGFLVGTVARVQPLPVTDKVLQESLPRPELVQMCIARHLRIEVDVDLKPSSLAANGWEWSSGRGPQHALPGGTELEAEIVLREVRPIEWVFPWVR